MVTKFLVLKSNIQTVHQGIGSLRLPTIPNLENIRFGRWLVTSFSHNRILNKKSYQYWNCTCDCGNKRAVQWRNLVQGKSKSCGCLHKEELVTRQKTHGETKTPLYNVWSMMHQRCYNLNAPNYKDYGGRGIRVHDRWHFYEDFKKDVYGTYKPKLTLDRVDNDLDYSKDNFKWSTQKEQQQNKRNSIKLTVHGQTATIRQWSDICGTGYQTIMTRYFRGYTHEECLYGKNITLQN